MVETRRGPTEECPVPKGAEVRCVACGKLLFRTMVELHHFEPIRATDFEPIPPAPSPVYGSRIECPYCKKRFLTNGNQLVYVKED